MRFQDLPDAIKALIEKDYDRSMEDQFKAIEGETMHAFFHQQHIQDAWVKYRADSLRQAIYEAERDGSWGEFLRDQMGLTND